MSITALNTSHWDIFCRVIDNHGDLGVCWRLSHQLAETGHRVRLWIDRPDDLRWMAPHGDARIDVRHWNEAIHDFAPGGDVVIEAFGCELPEEVQAAIAARTPLPASPGPRPAAPTPQPVWINLEYLSAEAYVARQHGLPSPVMRGPARGCTKWFFFPGFTPDTGGLLREPDLLVRQAAFDADAWLAQLGLPLRLDAQRISLFCYEPAGLPTLLQQLANAEQPTDLLVTTGRAQAATDAALAQFGWPAHGHGALAVHRLPLLTQTDFDHLLWSCDLNCVRGEDSLVRALWAGKPFVWHIYPQDDGAHEAKLAAFLDWLDAPASLRRFHAAWNGRTHDAAHQPAPTEPELSDRCIPTTTDRLAWQTTVERARQSLRHQTDLVQQLLAFTATRPAAP